MDVEDKAYFWTQDCESIAFYSYVNEIAFDSIFMEIANKMIVE